jgi:hypothetical protein
LPLCLAALLALAVLPAAALAVPGGTITGTIYYGEQGHPDKVGAPVEGILVKAFAQTGTTGLGDPIFSSTPAATALTDAFGGYALTVPLDKNYAIGVAQGAKDKAGTDFKANFYSAGEATITAAEPVPVGFGGPTALSNIDLYINPVGPSISGTVKGSDFIPNLPIAGATFGCYVWDTSDPMFPYWRAVQWSDTDPSGVFRFWDLSDEGPGTIQYRVGYEGNWPDIYGVRWMPEYWTPASNTTGVGATTQDTATNIGFTASSSAHITGKNFKLDKARKILSGTTFLGHTATPLGGVDVNLYDKNNMADGQYIGETSDDNGQWAVWSDQVSTPPTSTIIEFRRWGYRTNWYNDVTTDASATSLVVNPAMAPRTGVNGFLTKLSPSVKGTVRNGGGVGIPNVIVMFYDSAQDIATDPWPWHDWAITDDTGHYETYFEATKSLKIRFYTGGVPDLGLGEAGMATNYLDRWYNQKATAATADIVSVGVNTNRTADATLPINTPSVTGFVRTVGGAPVAGVVPYAFVNDGFGWYPTAVGTKSDATGAYRIYGLGETTVVVGFYEGFQPDGDTSGKYYREAWHGPPTAVPTPDTATQVPVHVGTTAANVNIAVQQVLPFLSGKVTSTKTGLGIADPWVDLWEDTGLGWDYANGVQVVSFANGTWAAYSTAPAGPYRIGFSADRYMSEFHNNAPDLDTATSVAVSAGTNTVINAALEPQWFKAMRYDGMDFGSSSRYTVAADIASLMTEGYDYNPDIILACGEDRAMADPLAAGGLSWAYGNAPMLLTPAGPTYASYSRPYTPRFVVNAIVSAVANVRATHRADGITLHVVGGTASVPDARIAEIRYAVQTRLGLSSAEAAKAFKVDRINGANRYENARLIAARMKLLRGAEMPKAAFVANGSDPTLFWDALSAAPISAGQGIPLVLVQTTGVPLSSTREISALGLTGSQLYIVGPTTSVSSGVQSILHATNRIKGATPDRFATARAVADWAISRGFADNTTTGITAALPDALGASTYLGVRGGTMLFASQGSTIVPSQTRSFLIARKSTLWDTFIFGGTGSVPTLAESAINLALKP